MSIINKFFLKLIFFYRLYILRDKFYLNISKWFEDGGDETLRFEYPLDSQSIVFDVGGYIGDYAEKINKKFGCKVYIFEPVTEFYKKCSKRFYNNQSITTLNYGLSSRSGNKKICLDNNASSFNNFKSGHEYETVKIRAIDDTFTNLDLKHIDLIKINIEGGEYELLYAIIRSGIIKKIKYLQIQFHNFIENSESERIAIRELLKKTHKEEWCYDFVWESWCVKSKTN